MIKIGNKYKRKFKFTLVVTVLTVILVGFMSTNDKDFEISKNLDIFISLFREVDQFYVDEKSPQELIESSINGMLESLDPYTTYIAESDMDDFKFMTTGQYGGIGALIRKAGDYTIISEPYEGSPAIKAGLHAGDTLLFINGNSVKGMDISKVSENLKGEPNTELKLIVRGYKDKAPVEKIFNREKISIKSVPYFGFIDNKIGYIRLTSFTRDASKEVRNAFETLKLQGAKGVILDLRGNPGGLLDEAVDITNIWVKKGQEIVNTKGKAKQWDKIYKTDKTPVDTLLPLAVLVNRGSASASEIVSGALQDLDRALIIGQRTFGKGLVQATRPLSYNTNLKITTAKYYIPSGRCIQALDYTHRNEDGSVGHIPDSLISEFKTKSGRLVYDGGGVKPDVTVESETPANISLSLYINNIFFDYASKFYAENDSIPPANEFQITDPVFEDFTQFVSSKTFDYNTSSFEKLNELIEVTKLEGYYSIAENDIELLRQKLVADKIKDVKTFRNEIDDLLSDEIVSRYYYQSGRIQVSLKDDKQLAKAIELLNDPATSTSILKGNPVNRKENVALVKKK